LIIYSKGSRKRKQNKAGKVFMLTLIKTIWIMILITILVGYACWSIFTLTTKGKYLIYLMEYREKEQRVGEGPTWYELYSAGSSEQKDKESRIY